MPDAVLVPRSPLEGLALPAGDKFALAEAPVAARFVFRGGEAALWLGPDEWLLIAEDTDAASLGAELEAALGSAPHSLVDVSHRQIGVFVSGPVAARALSAGCPLDLHPAAFPVGMATRTIFDKVEIVLWRRDTTAFHVETWRSFAPYLVAALTEAARGAPGW
jgi:sarcosine oxidase, subunit gamma